jgi:AraC-like DNA-binding protein
MYYNLDLLEKTIKDLATVIQGGSISIYESDYTCITYSAAPKTISVEDHSFCPTVNHKLKARCFASDEKAFSEVKDKEFYSYKCHAGLAETLIPLRQGDKIFAYICFGKYRLAEDETDEKWIAEYAVKNGVDPDFLVGEYRKTPLFSQKEVDSIISLIKAIFDYATLKNIVLPEEKAVFNDIKRFLSDNLERDLTVDSICDRFFLSKRQLYKLFKNNTGKTVMQYVQDLRVAEAKKLMVTTDLPLIQIAEKVGIGDYNYFIKIFKSKEGFTPKQYRLK